MDYFSGHADQGELLDYVRLNSQNKLKNIFFSAWRIRSGSAI
jgi:RNA-metabolising metallo-beta-lactamase.